MGDERSMSVDQHGDRRRRARDGIVDAIAESDDPKLKVVLRLLLTVVEEIGEKIDTVLADERGLRDVVLNGHADVHHAHHEWLAKRITEEQRDAEDAKEMARAGKKAAVEQAVKMIVTVVISLGFGAMGALHFLK